ncbi:hypothetical protein AmaxDRAFT_3323 [Limnospira maxima CS-328]|uniref:Uncharacterized protein n=1 Tax=Limnospira maxima CS-328 TaxID=513049 RepID=B5W3E5_LIMMA|nr:hypothetical protein AmaxDRAFT_3323 [Limnospira maxima CS-328]
MGNCHARFCMGGGRGDSTLDPYYYLLTTIVRESESPVALARG